MDFSLWLGIEGNRKDGGIEGILGRWSVVYNGNHSLVHLTDLQLASAGCPALSGSGFPYSAIDPQESKERKKRTFFSHRESVRCNIKIYIYHY